MSAESSNDSESSGTGRAARSKEASGEQGLTLTEVTLLVFVIATLAVIVTQNVLNSIERARLVKCMAEVRGIRAAIIMDSDREDIKFVVLCQHNHKHLGSYVHCVDAQPPVVVGGDDGAEDPKYTRFIKYEFGGPGGGSGKGRDT